MPIFQIPTHSRIENLELIARQVVEGFIIGLHKSPFHGFSVEFAEHRLYNKGDHLKHVDWKVFARKDRMFVKKFEEETNLRCCIAIDTSASMFFPDTENKINKLQYSCLAAASLLYLLKKQLDAGSLAYFDETLYNLSATRSGVRHYRQLIGELEKLINQGNNQKKTAAADALHELAERLHQRSLVIIFSDMPDNPESGQALMPALQHLKHNKHEVVVFHVADKQQEIEFNFENRPYEFVDMETGSVLKLHPHDVKENYIASLQAYRKKLEEQCLQHRIDLISCDLQEPVEQVLQQYLVKRNKMM